MKNGISSNVAEHKMSCPHEVARTQTEADCCKNIICEIEKQIHIKRHENCKYIILSEKIFSKLEKAFITDDPEAEKRIYQVNGLTVLLLPHSEGYDHIEVV